MEGVPSGTNLKEIEEKLAKLPSVREVHDLHIWLLSVGKPAMSAHIIADNPTLVLKKATKICR